MKMDMENKIKAVILGHAAADAVGVPAEFRSRTELDKHPVTDMRGHGTYNLPAGCWSDDTSMTLAALDSLASGRVDYDEIMSNFGKWYLEGKYTPTGVMFDIGGTCRQAILNYTRYNKKPLECGRKDAHSNGNGSLMRILPFVLYSDFMPCQRLELIREASMLTHAHPRAQIGCLIYSILVTHLLHWQSKAAIAHGLAHAMQLLQDEPEAEFYHRMFAPDYLWLERERIRSSGYVVDTLEAAVWCVMTTDSYEECVLKAVNLGEDTDTTAAVAGGLAGALYGLEGIPQEWLAELKRRKWIEEMCERAAKTWQNAVLY